jgi:hypothetical protein
VARIAAHGIIADPPRGWDAVIYRRPPQEHGAVGQALHAPPETPLPILHMGNFALPPERGDYGGDVVPHMRPGGVFVSILEHDPADAASRLFAGRSAPWPLRSDDVHPSALPRRFDGGAGHQAFFVAGGRPYCLFVAISGYGRRVRLVGEVNQALATVAFA